MLPGGGLQFPDGTVQTTAYPGKVKTKALDDPSHPTISALQEQIAALQQQIAALEARLKAVEQASGQGAPGQP